MNTGGVEYYYTLLGATVDGNIVNARTRTSNCAKLGVELHIKHVRGANHNAVGGFYVLAHVEKRAVELICADLGYFIE